MPTDPVISTTSRAPATTAGADTPITTTAKAGTTAAVFDGQWFTWAWSGANSDSGLTYHVVGQFSTMVQAGAISEDDMTSHTYTVYQGGALLYTVDVKNLAYTPAGGAQVSEGNIRLVAERAAYTIGDSAFDADIGLPFRLFNGSHDIGFGIPATNSARLAAVEGGVLVTYGAGAAPSHTIIEEGEIPVMIAAPTVATTGG